MGLSGVRRGAASPVVTYDFMDAGTFQSRPLFGGGGGGEKKGAGAAGDRFHGNPPFPLTDFALM